MTRKERYEYRKMNRRCIDCDAGLQEGDHVRCVECAERRQDALDRYSDTHADERNERAKAHNKAHREKHNAWNRKSRRNRIQLGKCACCVKPRAIGSTYCEEHREKHRIAALERWRRLHGKPSVAEVPSLRKKAA